MKNRRVEVVARAGLGRLGDAEVSSDDTISSRHNCISNSPCAPNTRRHVLSGMLFSAGHVSAAAKAHAIGNLERHVWNSLEHHFNLAPKGRLGMASMQNS